MNNIRLDEIIVKNDRVDYFFTVTGSLQKYFKKSNHLFFKYNTNLNEIPNSILAIPFVANIIPLVWITESNIYVDELDKSFYDALNNIRNGYQKMFPNLAFKGSISAKNIIQNCYKPEREAAALFSGGLDAHTTFIRVKDKNPLLITEYGWYEDDIENSDVWNADKENAEEFAKVNRLENILIQSNYGTFLKPGVINRDFSANLGDTWWHGLHHGLAIISAGIPIAYKLKVKCIYIASSNSPKYPIPCASDPTVDNEIKYSSGEVFHDGYELTRQDKVKVVVDYYSSFGKNVDIRVCFKNEKNCCKCEKCLRTIFGIIAEGDSPQNYGFEIVGNISKYLKSALDNEVKSFTDTFITMYWDVIQKRMSKNYSNIKHKEILEWFLDYNFQEERKKSLLNYRITQFFPIVKRRINTKIKEIMTQDN